MILKDQFGRDKEYSCLLEYLDDHRIFEIEKVDAHFSITEKCDCYFCVVLTKEQLKQLGEEIIKLSEE